MKYNHKDVVIDFIILEFGAILDLVFFYSNSTLGIISVNAFIDLSGTVLMLYAIWYISNHQNQNKDAEFFDHIEYLVSEKINLEIEKSGIKKTKLKLKTILIVIRTLALALVACFGIYAIYISIVSHNIFSIISLVLVFCRYFYNYVKK